MNQAWGENAITPSPLARKHVVEKERAPFFKGALPCCEVFRPRLIPAANLAALASPRTFGPEVNSLSSYFFLVFLAAFFFFICPLRIGLDLVAFLALRFITGIGTSAPRLPLDKRPLLIRERLVPHEFEAIIETCYSRIKCFERSL
jgi:hypothetical protein